VAEVAPRRQPPDVRRQQILDAAERVLVRRGLDDMTMADVAQEAGVAKGTVYLYFVSKAELLAELRTRYLDRLIDAMDPGPAGSTAAQLDRFVDELFAFSAANRELHHVLFHEAGYSEEDAFAGARRVVSTLVSAGIESGEWAVRDVEAATIFVLHGVHGLLVHGLHKPGSDHRHAAAAAKSLARGALGVS
jgi:AcrR family transcriptional regulator